MDTYNHLSIRYNITSYMLVFIWGQKMEEKMGFSGRKRRNHMTLSNGVKKLLQFIELRH